MKNIFIISLISMVGFQNASAYSGAGRIVCNCFGVAGCGPEAVTGGNARLQITIDLQKKTGIIRRFGKAVPLESGERSIVQHTEKIFSTDLWTLSIGDRNPDTNYRRAALTLAGHGLQVSNEDGEDLILANTKKDQFIQDHIEMERSLINSPTNYLYCHREK